MRQVARGFTLVELMAVVTIIGIVVLMAIPRVDVSGYRANSAVQVMGTTMLTAQRQAVTQQHDIVVIFDTAMRNVRIHEDRDNDRAVDADEHVRAVEVGEGMTYGLGVAPAYGAYATKVTFTQKVGGLPIVVFHRDGSASEAGGFYVTSQRAMLGSGKATDSRLVVVERATGRATWYAYRTNGWAKVF